MRLNSLEQLDNRIKDIRTIGNHLGAKIWPCYIEICGIVRRVKTRLKCTHSIQFMQCTAKTVSEDYDWSRIMRKPVFILHM